MQSNNNNIWISKQQHLDNLLQTSWTHTLEKAFLMDDDIYDSIWSRSVMDIDCIAYKKMRN